MRRYLWVALAIFLAPLTAQADSLAGPIPATVTRIIDADTLEVRVRIWLDQDILIKVRLARIDTPELFRPACDAERIKAHEGKTLVEELIGTGTVTLRRVHYGKYAGRVVADVSTQTGDLANALIRAGFANKSWCTSNVSSSKQRSSDQKPIERAGVASAGRK